MARSITQPFPRNWNHLWPQGVKISDKYATLWRLIANSTGDRQGSSFISGLYDHHTSAFILAKCYNLSNVVILSLQDLSKLWDSGRKRPCSSKIWQAPGQHCWRTAWQILHWQNKSELVSSACEISRFLVLFDPSTHVRPGKNGRHFENDIFKRIVLNETFDFFLEFHFLSPQGSSWQ